jgi:DNA-binding MarR family transcriptional regulator
MRSAKFRPKCTSKQPLRSCLSKGVCDQKTVERSLGMSNACASRSIDYWTRTGKKKLDFVKRYPDPDDRRRNLVKLTRKGQALFDHLRAI